MITEFHAVVETTDGTYRAMFIDPSNIQIIEDGEEGLTDLISLDEPVQPTKENLVHMLVVWVYEMRRGLEIKTVKVLFS